MTICTFAEEVLDYPEEKVKPKPKDGKAGQGVPNRRAIGGWWGGPFGKSNVYFHETQMHQEKRSKPRENQLSGKE